MRSLFDIVEGFGWHDRVENSLTEIKRLLRAMPEGSEIKIRKMPKGNGPTFILEMDPEVRRVYLQERQDGNDPRLDPGDSRWS